MYGFSFLFFSLLFSFLLLNAKRGALARERAREVFIIKDNQWAFGHKRIGV